MGATDMEIAAMYRDQAFGTQSEKMVDGRTIADLNAASFASYKPFLPVFDQSSYFFNDGVESGVKSLVELLVSISLPSLPLLRRTDLP